ncbi:MAG: hypothetical protein LBJ71_05445, partial [Holosporaceae bacterium]|nr:hypothetical protein [Holosporaceae bacterium]
MGSAEISIAISFVGFIYVFRTRIYPVVARALDEHIQSVQNKISEAESLKDESSLALKKAHTNKNSTAELIEKSKL